MADRNPVKWGSYTIGSNIPIICEADSRKQKPDYYVALPWHFMAEFKKREADFLKRGGKFVSPIPEAHVVRGSFKTRSSRREEALKSSMYEPPHVGCYTLGRGSSVRRFGGVRPRRLTPSSKHDSLSS